MSDDLKKDIINAINVELEAREAKAKATIQIYLNNPVGIADHSELLDEILKWANYGAEARDAREYLINHVFYETKE